MGCGFLVSQDFCLWNDRPFQRNANVCIIVVYIMYIYIHVYHDYLLYYNMSKFILVTCIFDASICLLILSIHTFVCLLFCLSKVVGFPKLVNSSQVKPVDMYFFSKSIANEQFHELYNPVNDPLCKHPDFSYGPSPVSGDFIAGQNLYVYEKFLAAGCLRPLERFIPF